MSRYSGASCHSKWLRHDSPVLLGSNGGALGGGMPVYQPAEAVADPFSGKVWLQVLGH